MEAEQVTEKILADANAEAEKINKEAEERETAEQAGFDEQLSDHKRQTEALAQKAAGDKKLHVLASARMAIAKEHLAEKRKILDEVFEQARRQLQELPDDDYRSLFGKLLQDSVETGDEEVIIDRKEKRINADFVKEVNRKLGPGFKGNLRLAPDKQDLGGGFILKRGKIKNNVSLEVVLAQARKELEMELAKDLFRD
ncbi:MAG: V-type ATP synthase subunit E [Planctomycetota bacterium]|jgi:V/A-type H+-transporting ATPase subunit E